MRDNDFCHTIEGEIVMYPFECDVDRHLPNGGADSRCGCRRAMAGLTSQRATTTFTVAELDMTVAEPAQMLADHLNPQVEQYIGRVDMEEMLADAHGLAEDAAHFRVDDVLEKRGDRIQKRSAERVR